VAPNPSAKVWLLVWPQTLVRELFQNQFADRQGGARANGRVPGSSSGVLNGSGAEHDGPWTQGTTSCSPLDEPSKVIPASSDRRWQRQPECEPSLPAQRFHYQS